MSTWCFLPQSTQGLKPMRPHKAWSQWVHGVLSLSNKGTTTTQGLKPMRLTFYSKISESLMEHSFLRVFGVGVQRYASPFSGSNSKHEPSSPMGSATSGAFDAQQSFSSPIHNKPTSIEDIGNNIFLNYQDFQNFSLFLLTRYSSSNSKQINSSIIYEVHIIHEWFTANPSNPSEMQIHNAMCHCSFWQLFILLYLLYISTMTF